MKSALTVLTALLIGPLTGFSVVAQVPVPLEILEPPGRAGMVREFPVTTGMIFLEGEIPKAPGGAVMDDEGRSVPFDWEVTGWWSPEKSSVKWLLLHFKASGDRTYAFVPGAAPAIPLGKPLATEHRIGQGRLIELVLGAGRDTSWKLEGIEAFVSARAADWFSPE